MRDWATNQSFYCTHLLIEQVDWQHTLYGVSVDVLSHSPYFEVTVGDVGEPLRPLIIHVSVPFVHELITPCVESVACKTRLRIKRLPR